MSEKEEKKPKKERKRAKKDVESVEKLTESAKKDVEKLEKKNVPLPNELMAEFRPGEELILFGVPFKVQERNGRDVVLRRTDIK